MVQVSSFALGAIFMASQAAAAATCVPGQIYCGFSLLVEPDYNAWKTRIDNALIAAKQPVDGTHESDSLFRCVTPTTLQFVDWCIDNGAGIRCQPRNNDACRRLGGVNDCCAR